MPFFRARGKAGRRVVGPSESGGRLLSSRRSLNAQRFQFSFSGVPLKIAGAVSRESFKKDFVLPGFRMPSSRHFSAECPAVRLLSAPYTSARSLGRNSTSSFLFSLLLIKIRGFFIIICINAFRACAPRYLSSIARLSARYQEARLIPMKNYLNAAPFPRQSAIGLRTRQKSKKQRYT